MAVLNVILAGAREIAARSLELQARQETTSISTAVSLASSTSTTPSSTASSTGDLTTSTPFPTNPPDNEPFKGNRDSTTSPLLFFVALGFGVVFTNLWIIVGVKYCFRYNARNRQLRMEASGDPVALENMPRPHRRRREKKLMTMDEVNEKFPMQKYKNWVAARAQEGLPTMGGISAPPSRANSVRSVEGVAPEVPSKERDSDEQRPTTSASTNRKLDHSASEEAEDAASKSTPTGPENSKDDQPSRSAETGQAVGTSAAAGERSNLERVDSEDDNDDEHINAALPPECIGTSGDACAICIETLEDDDDVRGLTCGHAFHAVCLDPWLTSRRACCPLCKADYYTPKPRPPPADANANVDNSGNGNVIFAQLRDSRRAQDSSHRFQPFATLLPSRFRRARQNTSQQIQQEQRPRSQRAAPQQQTSPTVPIAETRGADSANFLSNLRPSLPRVRLPRLPQLRRNRQENGDTTNAPPASGANAAVTPSQLEAGTRPAAAASASA